MGGGKRGETGERGREGEQKQRFANAEFCIFSSNESTILWSIVAVPFTQIYPAL